VKTILPLAFAACLALAGCVAPVSKSVQTQSGRPEIEANAELGKVKSAIIGRMVNAGYSVDQDTDYMLKMSKPLTGMQDFAARVSVGNSYSSNRGVVSFTFVKSGSTIRVIGSSQLSAQMPGGQVNTMELTDSGALFNELQDQLNRVKADVESIPGIAKS
jgi:hypothetical protein